MPINEALPPKPLVLTFSNAALAAAVGPLLISLSASANMSNTSEYLIKGQLTPKYCGPGTTPLGIQSLRNLPSTMVARLRPVREVTTVPVALILYATQVTSRLVSVESNI